MRETKQSSLPLLSVAVVVIGACILFYSLAFGDSIRLSHTTPSFAFQIISWVASFLLLGRRFNGNNLRLSDPLLLVLFWFFLYLVLPSMVWVNGGVIPFDYYISFDIANQLFWLHGLFIIAFVAGFRILSSGSPPRYLVKAEQIPSGWLLFLVPVMISAIAVFFRVWSGGGLLPEQNYAENVFAVHENILSARSRGGIDYILVQLSARFYFLPYLAQGVGMGFILARSQLKSNTIFTKLALTGSIVILMLIFGDGGRNDTMMIAIIGIVLCDLLIGKFPWRYILVALIIGLLIFDVLASYRRFRELPLMDGISAALTDYVDEDYQRLSEFTIMLSKEAAMLVVFEKYDYRFEGLDYPIRHLSVLVPGQLLPSKLDVPNTASLLGIEMLGSAAFNAGGGVAGTIIGDAYRFAGNVGIPIVAFSFGLIIAGINRWLLGMQSGATTNLIKLSLLAGVMGWLFGVVRSDPGFFATIIIYYVLILGNMLPMFLVNPTRDRVMKPLHVKAALDEDSTYQQYRSDSLQSAIE